MAETIPHDIRPMEAKDVEALPTGGGWQFEPKYDGFRCIAFAAGEVVTLLSRRGKPLGRYFPDVERAVRGLGADAVLDGELMLTEGGFDALQLRLHPAARRVADLAAADPAVLVAFDLLAVDGEGLLDRPLAERRARLAALLADPPAGLRLGKATTARATALRWLGGRGLDGVVAKRLDAPYRPGERATLKLKPERTVDCVVGGLYARASGAPEYLLLGLYDAAGLLDYVGRTVPPRDAAGLLERIGPLVGGAGFDGRRPGGRSRWSGRERAWTPLAPELVVEVAAGTVTGGEMRHTARLLRVRDDKDPRACTRDQID